MVTVQQSGADSYNMSESGQEISKSLNKLESHNSLPNT